MAAPWFCSLLKPNFIVWFVHICSTLFSKLVLLFHGWLKVIKPLFELEGADMHRRDCTCPMPNNTWHQYIIQQHLGKRRTCVNPHGQNIELHGGEKWPIYLGNVCIVIEKLVPLDLLHCCHADTSAPVALEGHIDDVASGATCPILLWIFQTWLLLYKLFGGTLLLKIDGICFIDPPVWCPAVLLRSRPPAKWCDGSGNMPRCLVSHTQIKKVWRDNYTRSRLYAA